ncbi:MAG: hypothetical protein H7099_06695 [Gemmatimonadaceae bacterium]|nr:hypothetical protein [Gemmatimonadaceae bacterium]
MARSLVMKRTIVPFPDRARYMEKLRKRKAYYTSAGCNFWVFEEAALNGAFIEFTEAPDRDTLQSALAGATELVLDANRIYQEISLS